MAKIEQTKCDSCAGVLQERFARTKDYIQIKGQVVFQHKDMDYTFVSPTPNSDLTFCDLICLGKYIEEKKLLWEDKKSNVKSYGADELSEYKPSYGRNRSKGRSSY